MTSARLLELYERMVLIRASEEEADRQEGATVGACAALQADDLLMTPTASHGLLDRERSHV
jgi:hypothetical protein